MTKARVLITEDELVVALDLERRLTKLGYEICAVVSTGERAMEKVGLLRPDLVLMDICLPGELDGIQAAAKIREAYAIPVIYLTANADDTTLRRAAATHPGSYLLKPFRERELQICIDLALQNNQLQRQLSDLNTSLETRVAQRTQELLAANEALNAEVRARTQAEQLARDQAALLDKASDAISVRGQDRLSEPQRGDLARAAVRRGDRSTGRGTSTRTAEQP
jgi:two-component system, cell cycle sensor histidine kinase and response regulator CckA